MHRRAEEEFDRMAGAVIAKFLLTLWAIALAGALFCFATEVLYRPGGRWKGRRIAEKALEYKQLQGRMNGGMGIQQAQIDSVFR